MCQEGEWKGGVGGGFVAGLQVEERGKEERLIKQVEFLRSEIQPVL